MVDLIKWLNIVTEQGDITLDTIELTGTIHACGCRVGELTRYTKTLVINYDQTEQTLQDIAKNVTHRYMGRRVVYNGVSTLEEMVQMSVALGPNVKLFVRDERVILNRAEKMVDVINKRAILNWFNTDTIYKYIPSYEFGLRKQMSHEEWISKSASEWIRTPLKLLNAQAVLIR